MTKVLFFKDYRDLTVRKNFLKEVTGVQSYGCADLRVCRLTGVYPYLGRVSA